MENLNLPENLEKLKHKIFEHMKSWAPAPNVQMHVPPADFPDASEHAAAAADDANPDVRVPTQASDMHVEHPAEFLPGRPGE